MIACCFLVAILCVIIAILCYHLLSYRRNIAMMIRQLDEIRGHDTNRLVRIQMPQKNSAQLINKINTLLKENRNNIRSVDTMNRHFRQGITSISHDLRTPLTTAGGYLEMLRNPTDTLSNQEQQEYLTIVAERQEMVRRLIEQLFEYARIEGGEITYEMERTDVKAVFAEVIALYYEDFCRKKMEPTIEVPDSPIIILGDVAGLRRIFSNLIYNALVHGGGHYAFRIEEEENGYRFVFSNDSEPMTHLDLENIFERFYTMDTSRTRKTTGLGLAIAKEITARMNGNLHAEYNNGRLSMIIWFPKIGKEPAEIGKKRVLKLGKKKRTVSNELDPNISKDTK